jgi:hypothetical protein
MLRVVGCYLAANINFGQIVLMCTKVVSHHITMFIPEDFFIWLSAV